MESFKTSDIGLTAYLRAKGYIHTEIEKQGRRVIFSFNKECEEISKGFLNSSEHKFYSELRIAKMMVMDENKML